MQVEVTVDDTHAEIVAGGFDAGIRIGEYIDRDMVAVRVSRPFSWLVLGSPGYFAKQGRPLAPEDIARHQCIRYRRPDIGNIYRWEFEREGQALSIDPPGSMLVNDAGLLRALGGKGNGAHLHVEPPGRGRDLAGPARAGARILSPQPATACSSTSPDRAATSPSCAPSSSAARAVRDRAHPLLHSPLREPEMP